LCVSSRWLSAYRILLLWARGLYDDHNIILQGVKMAAAAGLFARSTPVAVAPLCSRRHRASTAQWGRHPSLEPLPASDGVSHVDDCAHLRTFCALRRDGRAAKTARNAR
jgi:hypothetical protein